MFQDYAQFKYDIYKWRLETQVKSQLFSSKSIPGLGLDEENVGEKLKYDLGTPIFLNSLASKIHSKLVDTANMLAYH